MKPSKLFLSYTSYDVLCCWCCNGFNESSDNLCLILKFDIEKQPDIKLYIYYVLHSMAEYFEAYKIYESMNVVSLMYCLCVISSEIFFEC